MNDLITEYGTDAKINGNNTRLHIYDRNFNIFNKKEFANLITVILTKDEITPNDTVEFNNTKYRFLALLDAPQVDDEIVYFEIALYEDKFIDAIATRVGNRVYNEDTGETTFDNLEIPIKYYIDTEKTDVRVQNGLIEKNEFICYIFGDIEHQDTFNDITILSYKEIYGNLKEAICVK